MHDLERFMDHDEATSGRKNPCLGHTHRPRRLKGCDRRNNPLGIKRAFHGGRRAHTPSYCKGRLPWWFTPSSGTFPSSMLSSSRTHVPAGRKLKHFILVRWKHAHHPRRMGKPSSSSPDGSTFIILVGWKHIHHPRRMERHIIDRDPC